MQTDLEVYLNMRKNLMYSKYTFLNAILHMSVYYIAILSTFTVSYRVFCGGTSEEVRQVFRGKRDQRTIEIL